MFGSGRGGKCWGEWVGGLGQDLERWGGVMSMCVVSLDSLCWWQVQVSVYCARRIPAHLRCTQCSILLHLIDICFLTCICLWQISQIQTCLRVVVGPGLVSTSQAFWRSIASHTAGLHGRRVQLHGSPYWPVTCEFVVQASQDDTGTELSWHR